MSKNRFCFTLFLTCLGFAIYLPSLGNSQKPAVNNCKKDLECPDNAFCQFNLHFLPPNQGFCTCKEGYLMNLYNYSTLECVKTAKDLGEECRVDVQCQADLTIYSECSDGVCKCKENAHFEGGRCYYNSLIDQKCSTHNNCYLGPRDLPDKKAHCVRGKCQCGLDHSARDGGTRCLKDAQLGDKCEDDDHCAGENMKCDDVCRCEEGHLVHPLENTCAEVADKLGDSCSFNAQCTKKVRFSVCQNEKCECLPGYSVLEGGCWILRTTGQRCSSNYECITEDLQPGDCVNGICTCKGCDRYGRSSSTIPKLSILSLPLIVIIILDLFIYSHVDFRM